MPPKVSQSSSPDGHIACVWATSGWMTRADPIVLSDSKSSVQAGPGVFVGAGVFVGVSEVVGDGSIVKVGVFAITVVVKMASAVEPLLRLVARTLRMSVPTRAPDDTMTATLKPCDALGSSVMVLIFGAADTPASVSPELVTMVKRNVSRVPPIF